MDDQDVFTLFLELIICVVGLGLTFFAFAHWAQSVPSHVSPPAVVDQEDHKDDPIVRKDDPIAHHAAQQFMFQTAIGY